MQNKQEKNERSQSDREKDLKIKQLEREIDAYYGNLLKVRLAYKNLLKNQRISIFEKARKFINRQIENVLTKFNNETLQLTDQYDKLYK